MIPRCSECHQPAEPEDMIDGLCDRCVTKLLEGPIGSDKDTLGRYKEGRGRVTRRSAPSSIRGSKTVPGKSWGL